MTSSWVKISAPKLLGLQDIMLEETVKRNKKSTKLSATTKKTENYDPSQQILAQIGSENTDDSTSDALIAKLLQQEFDEECPILKHPADTFERTLQTPTNCYRIHQNVDFESETEEEENIDNFRDHKIWDQSDAVKEELEKHDAVLSPGNGTRSNVKLSKKIRARVKLYWKRGQSTVEYKLDHYSQLQIYKMIENRMLERVNYVISEGEEAVMLHANGNTAYPGTTMPKTCVLKVFKLNENGCNQHINFLAEQEMHKLLRLKEAGSILCPEVVALREHILILSFVGEDYLSYT